MSRQSPYRAYPTTAAGAGDPNYTIAYVAGSLTVTLSESTGKLPPTGDIEGGASTLRPGRLSIHSRSKATPLVSTVSRASGGIRISSLVLTRM